MGGLLHAGVRNTRDLAALSVGLASVQLNFQAPLSVRGVSRGPFRSGVDIFPFSVPEFRLQARHDRN